jgi:hypothetical protein
MYSELAFASSGLDDRFGCVGVVDEVALLAVGFGLGFVVVDVGALSPGLVLSLGIGDGVRDLLRFWKPE